MYKLTYQNEDLRFLNTIIFLLQFEKVIKNYLVTL